MTSRILPAALAVTALFPTACGGSSDSSGGEDLDIADQVLQQNGIDVDELGDDDLDIEDIAEMEGDAADAIDSLANSSGSASITIDGAPYVIDDVSCFDFDGSLSMGGVGTSPDGEPFWGEIDYTVNDRAEMLESGVFDEAFVEQMFGDKQQAVDLSVTVEIGKTDRFESAPDGKANYTADVFMDEPILGAVTFERSGSTVSGSGAMTDSNGVVVGYGELVPFEFSASCG